MELRSRACRPACLWGLAETSCETNAGGWPGAAPPRRCRRAAAAPPRPPPLPPRHPAADSQPTFESRC
ncbi:hypothetical protein ET475_07570 [Microbacterium protaetiae]|uniref:Uncharacterized protein n=1 Tax=Microbacterium protaetiae TaxID=2509458 RepID=A0A4P6ECA7_9MICO|nr:hypothetical protein ET475_07570 [Microbacterium protaetiae]